MTLKEKIEKQKISLKQGDELLARSAELLAEGDKLLGKEVKRE